ncbi:MAG TPA: ribose-phosphate pyrophosphokinase [Phycisphaerae bacterium]|nr:ribose-phosphate pyrophosphokinase [Phycisphaerae bacterium]
MTSKDGHYDSGRNIGELKVFPGRSSRHLTEKICTSLGLPVGKAVVDTFPDGETRIKLEDDVRGYDCFVVQSTCPPVDRNLMELLIFMDCMRRASAARITAVIPYFGYARQDRKSEGRTPITAKLVANLIVEAGADRVLTMDLHADQIQGFFDIPVDHLTAMPVLAEHFKALAIPNASVVSPDVGNLKTATAYATRLNADMAIIDKRRISGDRAEAITIIGEVKGRNVLIFDDMITTAGTVCEAANLVRKHGALDVFVGATHAVLAGPAFERLAAADLRAICVTDTVPLQDSAREKVKNLHVLSVSDLMGEAIRRIHEHRSISALFQ